MKKACIIRHAKSSWKYDDLDDHDRPLNGRGRNDAPEMSARLEKRGVKPDLLISSTAVRAMSTANLIAKQLDYPVENIKAERKLYGAGVSEWLDVIRAVDDSHHQVLLFGHNPAVTELVNVLTTVNIDNVPTCGMAQVDFDIEHWRDAAPENCRIRFIDYPKLIS